MDTFLRSGENRDVQHRNGELSHDSPTKNVVGTLISFFLLGARYLESPEFDSLILVYVLRHDSTQKSAQKIGSGYYAPLFPPDQD